MPFDKERKPHQLTPTKRRASSLKLTVDYIQAKIGNSTLKIEHNVF